MIYKELFLKDLDKRFKKSSAKLRIYISERNEAISLRPGMLVCPGGGYSFCSPREAEPIAFRFLSEGFNCFVLDYTVNEKYPAPHLDLAYAFYYIRKHEKEFDLIENSLSIIGFSAGGHLVCSYGYLYPELANMLKIDNDLLRPLSVVSCYSVVTTKNKTHGETRDIITGGDPKLVEKLDVPINITDSYPPTFLMTTIDDDCVPYENTIMLVDELKRKNVLHECHLYESGWHGCSLVNRSCYQKKDITKKMEDIRDWATHAADFIFKLIDKSKD